MFSDCPYCRGRGSVKSPLRMSVEIQRQVAATMRKHARAKLPLSLLVIVHPTVLDRLRQEDEEFLVDLQQRFEGRLSFRSDPTKHVEFFCVKNAETDEMLYASSGR
jgi:ribonuclease G